MRVAGRKAATNERVSICINLREQLRIDELRELLEFCDQQWCCVAMRVGITLTPAPSTQIASTHELLEDDELTRIHDMAIDFRWITAVEDRKRVVWGKSVYVGVDIGGGRGNKQ